MMVLMGTSGDHLGQIHAQTRAGQTSFLQILSFPVWVFPEMEVPHYPWENYGKYRIIELFRLETISKIIKSNFWPNTTAWIKPRRNIEWFLKHFQGWWLQQLL